MRRLLAFQHVLSTWIALVGALVLAWHRTLSPEQVVPIITTALMYGLGGQAIKNGNDKKEDER